jgi:hypothetical protein
MGSTATARRRLLMPFAWATGAALIVVALNLGTMRIVTWQRSSEHVREFQWQNGWPLVFLARQGGHDKQGDPEAWMPGKFRSFSATAAAGDCFVLVGVWLAVYLVAKRRQTIDRPWQFGLRSLLLAVLVLSISLARETHVQRRQNEAVERLQRENIGFGFLATHGLPHWLRRLLPGGRLRLFDRVTYVECGGPQCVDVQVSALAELPDLVVLDIGSNEIRNAGFSYLAGLRNLAYLTANSAWHIDDDGVAHLSCLRKLKKLDLASTKVTDHGLAYLSPLVELEDLNLDSCKISDAGIAHLAANQKLRKLILIGSDISDGSLPVLMRFKNLLVLDVRGTRITPEGVVSLKRAVPECRIDGP